MRALCRRNKEVKAIRKLDDGHTRARDVFRAAHAPPTSYNSNPAEPVLEVIHTTPPFAKQRKSKKSPFSLWKYKTDCQASLGRPHDNLRTEPPSHPLPTTHSTTTHKFTTISRKRLTHGHARASCPLPLPPCPPASYYARRPCFFLPFLTVAPPVNLAVVSHDS